MKRVALVFGGLSNEHDVSIMSARNIEKHIDVSQYALSCIFWGKDGVFYRVSSVDDTFRENRLHISSLKGEVDMVLLMTHGKYGEDGVIQGMLEAHQIPYCGSRVLGSALCMDKAVCKTLMKAIGVRQVNYAMCDVVNASDEEFHAFIEEVKSTFTLPVFVKPANSGSSVGVSKVKAFEELPTAIREASVHDSKILVEQGLEDIREIEVAVLGNTELVISSPGELLPAKEFYDYDDKYVLGKSSVSIPAVISLEIKDEIQRIAKQAYSVTNCKGFARVDFFLKDGVVYLNEINTLPGFTDISMYPLLMQHEGVSYQKLIERIIELGY